MKKLIVANWKMNPETPREARELFGATKKAATKSKARVVVCPPAVFLPLLKSASNVALGAQDAYPAASGAYTGFVSASMVAYSGAQYVIIGHSERRAAGEGDDLINQKIKWSLKSNLKIILCVGERERDHDGKYLNIIKEQLEKDLVGLSRDNFTNLIIAYEPVWAIGAAAKASDTPEGFREQAIFIRKVLSMLVGAKVALGVPVLYGGSVDTTNAKSFLTDGHADGLLVGRASLRADIFVEILKQA